MSKLPCYHCDLHGPRSSRCSVCVSLSYIKYSFYYSVPQCSLQHCKRCIHSISICLSVYPSVCLSVCHTQVLCQNDST